MNCLSISILCLSNIDKSPVIYIVCLPISMVSVCQYKSYTNINGSSAHGRQTKSDASISEQIDEPLIWWVNTAGIYI